MKNFVALVALIASSQACAFWGWDNSNNTSQTQQQGNAHVLSEANAEAELAFDFRFTGRGKTFGLFNNNANTGNQWNGYGFQSTPYYQGYPVYGAPVTR